MPPLFAETERTDASPRLYAEDSFAFLNRAAGDTWERTRATLNAWYTAFPDENGDLRQRFRSPDPRLHYAAWWELYLHRLLTALGFELTVHPDIPGSSGHPDFLAERGDESFYVEAVTVFSGIVAPGRRGKLEAKVQDIINTIDAPTFMLNIGYQRVGESMPRKRAITQPIEAWLNTLDPEQLLAEASEGKMPASTTITFGDWEMSLRAIPRLPEYRGRAGNQLIGLGPSVAGFTNDTLQLRRALTRKSKHYGTPDKPLLVAALATNGFADINNVVDALLGSQEIRLEIATGASTVRRRHDGVWVGRNGPAGRRMSALLMGIAILPETCARVLPQLWHHFSPRHQLDSDLPFLTARAIDDELEFTEATRTASEVIGLPDDWPGLRAKRPDDGD